MSFYQQVRGTQLLKTASLKRSVADSIAKMPRMVPTGPLQQLPDPLADKYPVSLISQQALEADPDIML
ncbi:hypothetical protein [Dictyobacter vulcani]|uniref:hypothetical protein n=1 Tax=Dictyobacter vulcani TaxID=2607529 RepID=UPI001387080B|nr:hypothetical protein [Dictyobacter vulcani]